MPNNNAQTKKMTSDAYMAPLKCVRVLINEYSQTSQCNHFSKIQKFCLSNHCSQNLSLATFGDNGLHFLLSK